MAVDSSVLGRDCDGHVHRFFEAREEQHEPDHFTIDLGNCLLVQFITWFKVAESSLI